MEDLVETIRMARDDGATEDDLVAAEMASKELTTLLGQAAEKDGQPAPGSSDLEGSTGAPGESRYEQQLLLELAILTMEIAVRIGALEVGWRRRGAERGERAGRRASGGA